MKVLVSRTDKIGDLILSMPVAKFIKSLSPKHRVFYLVRKGLKDIIERFQFADGFLEVETVGERGDINIQELPKIAWLVRRFRFDFCLLLYPKPLLALALKLCGVKIVGSSRRAFSFLFDHKVNISRKQNLFHEAYYNILMLEPVVKEASKVKPSDVFDKLKAELKVEQALCDAVRRKFSLPDVYVSFHPFSGGSSPAPDLGYFCEVARFIRVPVVWVGRRSHKSEPQLRPEDVSLINRTSLAELLAVLKTGLMTVSPSSGPIHISSALGVYTLGFYRTKDIVRWMPLSTNQQLLDVDDPPEPKVCADEINKIVSSLRSNI